MDRRPLGPLAQRVMTRLWTAGAATVGEMLAALNDTSDHPLAYTTVMTILVRLTDKGFVSRNREGRQYRYSAALSEGALAAEVGRRELHRLIEKHGAGTLAGFAADLAGADGDLAKRLRSLAATADEL